jgi:tRNA(fMet)-specific endonuclease VapC
MYILDTDHLSVIDREGVNAQSLLQRLAGIDPTQVATSIISYEEQMRGWLSYTARAQTVEKQVEAYKQLKRQLTNLRIRNKTTIFLLCCDPHHLACNL